LHADSLGILEMTGIVESDAGIEPLADGAGRELRENFAYILTLGGETTGTIGICGIAAEQVAVLLDVGAAAGSVGDDGIDVCWFEGVDDAAGEIECTRFLTSMHAECTAARLAWRGDHFTAFCGEDAGGSGVDVRKKGALNTAEKKADTLACFALCESDRGNLFDGSYLREKGVHGGEGFRKKMKEADGAEDGLQAGFLIGEERPAEELQTLGLGKGFK
jgi:hypothetical protein